MKEFEIHSEWIDPQVFVDAKADIGMCMARSLSHRILPAALVTCSLLASTGSLAEAHREKRVDQASIRISVSVRPSQPVQTGNMVRRMDDASPNEQLLRFEKKAFAGTRTEYILISPQ